MWCLLKRNNIKCFWTNLHVFHLKFQLWAVDEAYFNSTILLMWGIFIVLIYCFNMLGWKCDLSWPGWLSQIKTSSAESRVKRVGGQRIIQNKLKPIQSPSMWWAWGDLGKFPLNPLMENMGKTAINSCDCMSIQEVAVCILLGLALKKREKSRRY